MSDGINYEKRPVNEMTTVSASDNRKILSGDGPILLSDILQYINSEPIDRIQHLEYLSMIDEDKLSEVEENVNNLLASNEQTATELASIKNSMSNIAVGSMAFNAIKFSVVENGSVSDEYGYLVMKKSADGNLKFSALTQAEYEEIFGTESEGE